MSILDGGFAPLPAKEVTLFFAKPDAGIEPLRMPATRIEGASWRVDDVQLPLAGIWQVRVEILVSDFEKITLEDAVELRRCAPLERQAAHIRHGQLNSSVDGLLVGGRSWDLRRPAPVPPAHP